MNSSMHCSNTASLALLAVPAVRGNWWPVATDTLLNCAAVFQGLDRLAEFDYVAIFDADFKPDADFLVSPVIDGCVVAVAFSAEVVAFLLSW